MGESIVFEQHDFCNNLSDAFLLWHGGDNEQKSAV